MEIAGQRGSFVSVKRKLIRNTFVNYGISIWGFLLNFFMFWFIVGHIGEADYGIYLFVTAIIGYFGILNLGIGNSLIKFVAEYHTKKDYEKLNEVINTTFFIFLFIGIIGAVIIFLIGTFLLDYLTTVLSTLESPDFYPKARAIIYLLGANFIFSLSLASLRGVLAGLQRYDILAKIAFIMSLINLAVVVSVLSLGYGIVDLVFYTTIIGLLGFVMIVYYIHKLLPNVRIKYSFMNRGMTKVLFDLSISVFLLSIMVMIIYYTDRLVIGLFIGVPLITFYHAAWTVWGIPAKIPEIGLVAVLPAASELEANKNLQALRKLFLRGTKYILAICIALAVPLFFLSKEVLILYMGDDYGKYHIIIQILIIALFFDFNNYLANQILIGMNRIKKFVKYYGVVAVMNLGLSILLVQLGFGLKGVALGTTIPFVLLEVFFLRHIFNVLGIKWRTYAKDVAAKTFPYASVVAILLYILLLWRTPVVGSTTTIISIIDVGAYFLLGCGVYMLLFYIYGLETYEKEEIRRILSRIKARINVAGREEK